MYVQNNRLRWNLIPEIGIKDTILIQVKLGFTQSRKEAKKKNKDLAPLRLSGKCDDLNPG